LARIRLGDPAAARALVRALREARCLAVHRDGFIDVFAPGRAADDEAQARMELRFFLRALARDDPRIAPQIVWVLPYAADPRSES
jgi:hypothetical protein